MTKIRTQFFVNDENQFPMKVDCCSDFRFVIEYFVSFVSSIKYREINQRYKVIITVHVHAYPISI